MLPIDLFTSYPPDCLGFLGSTKNVSGLQYNRKFIFRRPFFRIFSSDGTNPLESGLFTPIVKGDIRDASFLRQPRNRDIM